MLKKLTGLSLVLLALLFSARIARAESKDLYFDPAADGEKQVDAEALTEKNLYFFWSKTCPHCAREKIFLEKLADKYPQLEIKQFEINESRENQELFKKVGEKFAAPGYVPFTVVGEYHFVGYLDDQTTGQQIEEAVQCFLADGCQDVVQDLVTPPPSQVEKKQALPETLTLPLLGEIKIKNLSLPALTFIIALLDGFNPCAMWTLIFLISFLLGVKDSLRRWTLGVAFIVASGVVYFLFLSAWLNLFLFLGFVLGVRILVGLIALGAGGYNLREYWQNKDGTCKVTKGQKRQQFFDRLKGLAENEKFLLALGGVILLALAVNLVELVCSAGLPAVYTQILSLSNLPGWQYYLYLLFYILIFMLDDLLVFFVAMFTLQATGIQTKYARYSHLIGGILMVAIGLLLLFKPEWLMFG